MIYTSSDSRVNLKQSIEKIMMNETNNKNVLKKMLRQKNTTRSAPSSANVASPSTVMVTQAME